MTEEFNKGIGCHQNYLYLLWPGIRIKVNGERLNHLRFAHNIILIIDNGKILKYINSTKKTTELKMNFNKTKTMCLQGRRIVINKNIENLNEYTYLSQNITLTTTNDKYQSRREIEKNGQHLKMYHTF